MAGGLLDAVLLNKTYLSYWLLFVGNLRLLSVALGYFAPKKLKDHVFVGPNGEKAFTDTLARTFAVWTTLSCLACIYTAMNIGDHSWMQFGQLSFVVALGYFMVELFVHKTVSFKSALSPFIVATTSLSWLTYAIANIKKLH